MPFNSSPPYDSPLEDTFAYHLAKYAGDDIQIDSQVPANTICRLFLMDFVAHSPRIGRIGIECDGKEFHNDSRDEWRDAMILGTNTVDVIYRVRGSDITHHINDVLYCLAQLEPGLCSERGEINLRTLASSEARKLFLTKDEDLYHVHYTQDEKEGSLFLETRRLRIPQGQRRFWQSAYKHALSVGGGNLDDVILSYRQCP